MCFASSDYFLQQANKLQEYATGEAVTRSAGTSLNYLDQQHPLDGEDIQQRKLCTRRHSGRRGCDCKESTDIFWFTSYGQPGVRMTAVRAAGKGVIEGLDDPDCVDAYKLFNINIMSKVQYRIEVCSRHSSFSLHIVNVTTVARIPLV